MSRVLKKEIRDHLKKILGMTRGSIAVRISEIKNEYPQLTPAAAAAVLARRKEKSIMRFLDNEDKKTLATVRDAIVLPAIIRTRRDGGLKPPARGSVLIFPSSDRFVERHVAEINGTYNAGCYTATFILCRKVMENLIIQILKKKFSAVKDRNKYEDQGSRRSLDFSVVLDNLYKSRNKFSISTASAIQRIKQKATAFKNDANDKAHSLFHIATKSEIESANVQEIFDLISVVIKEVGA